MNNFWNGALAVGGVSAGLVTASLPLNASPASGAGAGSLNVHIKAPRRLATQCPAPGLPLVRHTVGGDFTALSTQKMPLQPSGVSLTGDATVAYHGHKMAPLLMIQLYTTSQGQDYKWHAINSMEFHVGGKTIKAQPTQAEPKQTTQGGVSRWQERVFTSVSRSDLATLGHNAFTVSIGTIRENAKTGEDTVENVGTYKVSAQQAASLLTLLAKTGK